MSILSADIETVNEQDIYWPEELSTLDAELDALLLDDFFDDDDWAVGDDEFDSYDEYDDYDDYADWDVDYDDGDSL